MRNRIYKIDRETERDGQTDSERAGRERERARERKRGREREREKEGGEREQRSFSSYFARSLRFSFFNLLYVKFIE